MKEAFVAVLIAIVANELHSYGRQISQAMIRTATLLLPRSLRSDRLEEQLRHAEDIADAHKWSAVVWAGGCFIANAREMHLRKRLHVMGAGIQAAAFESLKAFAALAVLLGVSCFGYWLFMGTAWLIWSEIGFWPFIVVTAALITLLGASMMLRSFGLATWSQWISGLGMIPGLLLWIMGGGPYTAISLFVMLGPLLLLLKAGSRWARSLISPNRMTLVGALGHVLSINS